MHTAMEINKPLVEALRMSEPLPNIHDVGVGTIRLLYAEHFRPVGYLVEKIVQDDAWESLEPRFFLTTSHAEAMELLAAPYDQLPAREISAS